MRSLEARRPTLLFCNAIGDHLLALPAVRALATTFPGRLTLVCRRGARKLFFADVDFGRVVEVAIEQRRRGHKVWEFDADVLARKLSGCDLFLSLNSWHSQSLDRLLHSLSPRESVGFSSVFQRPIPMDFTKHSADLAFDLPRRLNRALRIEDFSAPPALPARARRWARGIRAALPPHSRILVIHADSKAEKMWPRSRWVSLLDQFLCHHPDFVAFDVGLENHQLDHGVEGDRVIPSCGLSLHFALALIAEAELFVGIDSSFLHAADLFRVPGVGMFGPTAPSEWGFRFAPHRHVWGKGTMTTIGVPSVLKALNTLA